MSPNVEDQLLRAIQEGKFDDLPGKGRPLKMDENPLGDPEWRLAYHILQSGGFTMPWIERRQEIEKRAEMVRTDLVIAWKRQQSGLEPGRLDLSMEAEWQQAAQSFREQVHALNRQIFNYILEAPMERFHLDLINLERELRAVTSRYFIYELR